MSGVLGVGLVAARRIEEDYQARVHHVKEFGDARGHVHTTTFLSSNLEQKTLDFARQVPGGPGRNSCRLPVRPMIVLSPPGAPASTKSVAGAALEGECVGVMDDPIDRCGGDGPGVVPGGGHRVRYFTATDLAETLNVE